MPLKRNVDIVREILLRASREDHFEPPTPLAAQHTVLLIDLGYLEGWYIQEDEGKLSYVDVRGLTGKGRTLLEAVRNEAVWRKTKRVLADDIDRAPLEAIRVTAEKLVSQSR